MGDIVNLLAVVPVKHREMHGKQAFSLRVTVEESGQDTTIRVSAML
jgi:hypothetical protein